MVPKDKYVSPDYHVINRSDIKNEIENKIGNRTKLKTESIYGG